MSDGDKPQETTPPDRPTFDGCVFCYSAELTLYGIKKLSTD